MKLIITYLYIYIITLLLYLNIIYGKNITLNVIAYSVNENDDYYTTLINEFNTYSEENNLNIKLDINLFENSNTYDTFGSVVESLLIRRTKKYDLFYYDSSYTQKYGNGLLDLKKYLPKEHIEMYDKKLISESCTYEDKLIGLPYRVSYSLLYSNDLLLTKYNKTIPKTWDELIETSKYIMERENDPELVAYNGLFDNSEHGLCSFIEFLYSCRNSKESLLPDVKSESTMNALKLIKKIKDEVSSKDIFQSDFGYSVGLLLGAKGLFIKIWNIPTFMLNMVPYRVSVLPGIKEGISGTAIAGYNLGINRYISEEKLDAAIEAFKFLTSKEIQKKYLTPDNMVTGITSLYDEVELCKLVDCEIYKNVQTIGRPSSKIYSISKYNNKIITYFHQFLFENQTASQTVEHLDNLTRYHYISLSVKDTRVYAIILITIIVLLVLIILSSLSFLFIKKFRVYYYYLTNDLWIMSILGILIIMSSCLTYLGPVTSFKCQLYISLMMVGHTLNLIPILYMYIINFPERNNVSKWVFHHKYIFISIFIFADIILVMLYSLEVYRVSYFIIDEGKNYKFCGVNGTYGYTVYLITFIIYLIFFSTMLIFSYIEWNFKVIFNDVRLVVYAIYADIISISLLFMFSIISINSNVVYFVAVNALILLSAILSYLFIYLIRITFCFNKKKDDEVTLYINTVFNLGDKGNKSVVSSNIYFKSGMSGNSISIDGRHRSKSVALNRRMSTKDSIFLKLVNYHNNRNNISSSYIVDTFYKSNNEKTKDSSSSEY